MPRCNECREHTSPRRHLSRGLCEVCSGLRTMAGPARTFGDGQVTPGLLEAVMVQSRVEPEPTPRCIRCRSGVRLGGSSYCPACVDVLAGVRPNIPLSVADMSGSTITIGPLASATGTVIRNPDPWANHEATFKTRLLKDRTPAPTVKRTAWQRLMEDDPDAK